MSSFKIPTYIFSSIVLCLTTFSYHSAVASQNVIIDLNKPISAALLAQYNRDGIEIDYDDTTVLKQVYVTEKDGAIARQLPSGAARKVKSYTFGEKLDVIEDRKDWYTVRDSIDRQYDENNDGVIDKSISQWEKVFVKKDLTDDASDIRLTDEDIHTIRYLSVGDFQFFDEEKQLDKYLEIELIDRALFEKKRPIAVNFLSKNAKGVHKKSGVLSIPTTNKLVTFADNDVDNDGYQIFDYIGQMNVFNQHIVHGSYWEAWDYKMIDKHTGAITQTFSGYPYLSPDKKYIITTHTNPYEEQTELTLYKVYGKNFATVLDVGFSRWMVVGEMEDSFWARDGYLYLSVNHRATVWTAEGDLNQQHQYIRIKVDL
ncbi:hypothetical protein [Psychrobacter sp.]|uniref:hypothetical protein n=1 Tax=Psychrobacter sp. TaxID=56811 RepID=UPI003C76B223